MTKKLKTKTKKKSNAILTCEHDRVGYAALESLAKLCVNRSQEDEKRFLFYEQQLKSKDQIIERFIFERSNTEEFVVGLLEQNQEIWKERNDAVLAYKALHDTGELATQLGIDTKSKKLPHEKDFFKDYEMYHAHRITEDGKEKYKFIIKKRESADVQGSDRKKK